MSISPLPPALATPPPATLPSHLRELDDMATTRKWLTENTLTALGKRFPYEDATHRLELSNLRAGGDTTDYGPGAQKKALLQSRKLTIPIKGTWRLVDRASGTTIEERDDTVMHLPYLTERGTFLNNGTEYSGLAQSRLKPGVYTRQRRTGDVEAHFNLKGRARGFRLDMEPETGVFKMNMQQASLPLYHVLKAVGVTDDRLKEAWGPEVWMANAKTRDTGVVGKLFKKFFPRGMSDVPDEAPNAAIRRVLMTAGVDPTVMRATVGLDTDTVNDDVFIKTSRRLLDIHKGMAKPDDRDHPAFSRILGVEDQIPDRIERDAGKLARAMFWKAKNGKGLKRIPPGALNSYVSDYILNSGLAMPLEETNHLSLLEQMHRVTKFGDGGIAGEDSLTDEARDVNPGQLGFIDPVAAPECFDAETEVFTSEGWVPWPNVSKDTLFAVRDGDAMVFRKAERLIAAPYVGQMYRVSGKFLDHMVTPTHRCWCRKRDDKTPAFRFIQADRVVAGDTIFETGGYAYAGDPSLCSSTFELPSAERRVTKNALPCGGMTRFKPFDMALWCEFLGYYLSEGSMGSYSEFGEPRAIRITQSYKVNAPVCSAIEKCLTALGVRWSYSKDDITYTICGKQLAMHLRQYAGSRNVRIPEYVQHAPAAVRRTFLDAYVAGDGRLNKSNHNVCTTSPGMAADIRRLITGLGLSSYHLTYSDKRKETYYDMHEVSIHRGTTRCAQGRDYYSKEAYNGMVYCATVPSGLLLVKRRKSVPMWSGNSGAAGADFRLAYKTYKGKDNQMYAEFKDSRTGKMSYLRPEDTLGKVIAFPNQMDTDKERVSAIIGGQMADVDRAEVDYEVPTAAHMYSPNTNLNPMRTAYQAGRGFYSSKFWPQYMPLVSGETPLVEPLVPDDPQGRTMGEFYGNKLGAIRASEDGTVSSVSEEQDGVRLVKVKGVNGTKTYELVQNAPFNRLTGATFTPTVKPGDVVTKDQLIAHSNFTDSKTGALNLGRNLRVAVIPYKGESYEDGMTISETAAKMMANDRLFAFDETPKNGTAIGTSKYVALFPGRFTKQQLANMDTSGVVKVGTVLKDGDPIVLAVGPRVLSAEAVQMGKLHKSLRNTFTDKGQLWENDYDGVVVDSVVTPGGKVRVSVKAQVPVKQADKMADGFGLKGVVNRIIPDEEMPRDPVTNEPYHVLMNPLGMLSRVADGSLLEIGMAKLAKKLGHSVKLPVSAPKEGWDVWLDSQLKEHGVESDEMLYDPLLKRNIGPVLSGYKYYHAFHHIADKKMSDRGAGGSYTAEEQPARGGGDTQQAKRSSRMDMDAMLAHGATGLLREIQTVRGAKNDDFWRALRSGRPLPDVKVPLIYDKFLDTLRAGGIQVRDQGDTLKLFPMTDADVGAMSKGELTSSEMVDAEFRPITGGLFDVGKTGGVNGKRWTHITLPEPVPNPVFEDPIRRLLGVTKGAFRNILAGREELNGKRGGAAILSALQAIDVDKEIERNKDIARKRSGNTRDGAIKALGYLGALKRNGVKPTDWVITQVPVLPPIFRPISKIGDVTLQADLNELYRDLFETSKSMKALKAEAGDDAVNNEREQLYDAVSAVFGLGDPITPEGVAKRLKGAVRQITGETAKMGIFQSRVLSKPVDSVGRAVVTADPNMHMDQVGIPEDSAWVLYRNHVLRRLSKRGIPMEKSLQMLDDRDPLAYKEMREEMKVRPVILDRAPTWHKFNLLAFYPIPVKGSSVRASPLISKGFTLDHDGDQMNFHVPATDDGVSDALTKMLPSKNLTSLTDLYSPRHTPQQEFILGLYAATREPSKKPPRVFATAADAKRAFDKGELKVNDPIQIGG